VRRGFQGTTINLPDVSNEFRWPRASVLGRDDLLTRLQDRQHRPAVPTPQVQDVLGAKHDAHRVVPAEGTRRVLNAGPLPLVRCFGARRG
jgi:hypothetical protein